MSTNAEIEKLMEESQKSKITCSCGHRVFKPKRKDKVICSWCHNYVFIDKQTEFKYRLEEQRRRNKRNGN